MDYSNSNYIVDENAMDVDGSDQARTTTQMSGQPALREDEYDNDIVVDVDVVVSSVGLHVEGPIPFINPEIPVEHHAIVQIDSNDVEGNEYRASPAASVASSRAPSPIEVPGEEDTIEIDENAKKKRNLSDDEDDDDGRLCPICLDNWTNTGEHRICALKCGHLFGYKCVNRWLESQQKKTCPTCKKRVKRTDLRYIYAKKLIAVDTTEIDMLRNLLDAAVEEKNKINMTLNKYEVRERLLTQEIAHLKRQIQQIQELSGPVQSHSNNVLPELTRLYKDKSLEICRQSGCRVFDVNCASDLIMVSMKTPTSLFSGYGIRKVNISQYKPLAFIPLHNLQIRDMCFHPVNTWILTASMDKTFKVVDTITNTVLYTTAQQMPLWSCCWDTDNQYVLYIGTQSGSVVKYDVRNIHEPVYTMSVPNDMSPVVAVASIPAGPGSDIPFGGVISCKLNSTWLYENSHGSDYIRKAVPLDGPFVSMKYQPETKQLLISARPNNKTTYSRHILCTLENGEDLKCNVVHCFQGGGMQKLLSKSCFVADRQQYVAAHQESNKSIYLWSINTGERVCAVPSQDAVLDLGGFQSHCGNYLVSLTERKLDFFKFH